MIRSHSWGMIGGMTYSGSNHRRVVVETVEEDAPTPELPSFLRPQSDTKTPPPPVTDDVLDFKELAGKALAGISYGQSVVMSVPAFITILVILVGFTFIVGRISVGKSDKVQADDAQSTLEPISLLSKTTTAPVQGTPDEIIASVRTLFSTAIETSKNPNQSATEKEAVSKTILEVLDMLGKGISAYPDVASLYFERAQVEKMVMQSAPSLKVQAESDYNKATSLSPLTSEYYVGHADYYSVIGDKQKAIDAYEKALQLDPKSIDALYSLATLYSGSGRNTEAKALFVRILSLLSPSSNQYAQIQQAISALEPQSTASASASPN